MSNSTPNRSDLEWVTASQDSACVQVAFTPDAVYVSDTKDPTGPMLEFTPREWDVFSAGMADGVFDRS